MSQKRIPPSLTLLREQIDRLDAQILHLLNRRASLAKRIGQLKSRDRAMILELRLRIRLTRRGSLV